MCGRYSILGEISQILLRFDVDEQLGLEKFSPRYNVAPTQKNPVVFTNEQKKRILMPMRWGLIPRWAKDETIGNRMINARAETVSEKPSFKDSLMRRRCLIPADGYYEWEKTGKPGKRTPFRIVLKSNELFAFAGLWEVWTNQIGQAIRTYTIITTQADELVGKIHPRMPIILKPENENVWLDPELKSLSDLKQALIPLPADLVEMYEVSPLVGNPQNDTEEVIKPIKKS